MKLKPATKSCVPERGGVRPTGGRPVGSERRMWVSAMAEPSWPELRADVWNGCLPSSQLAHRPQTHAQRPAAMPCKCVGTGHACDVCKARSLRYYHQNAEALHAKEAVRMRRYRAAKQGVSTTTADAIASAGVDHEGLWALWGPVLEAPLAKGLALPAVGYWWNGNEESGCSADDPRFLTTRDFGAESVGGRRSGCATARTGRTAPTAGISRGPRGVRSSSRSESCARASLHSPA
jgi:hypothetical protein